MPPVAIAGSVASAVSLSIASAYHVAVGIGLTAGMGPFLYDPGMFLVRGEPAQREGGLEAFFPVHLGLTYLVLISGLPIAMGSGSPAAVRTACFPCILYHGIAACAGLIGGYRRLHVFNQCKMSQAYLVLVHGAVGSLFLVAAATFPAQRVGLGGKHTLPLR